MFFNLMPYRSLIYKLSIWYFSDSHNPPIVFGLFVDRDKPSTRDKQGKSFLQSVLSPTITLKNIHDSAVMAIAKVSHLMMR